MKKMFLVVAICCLAINAATAQFDPDIEFDNNTSCLSDMEIKVYTVFSGTSTQNGESGWVTPPASGTWDYTDVTNFAGWVTDPGTPSMLNNWHFYKIDVRNCNSPSSGSTGPNCGSGNLDGVTLDMTNHSDCFEYSGNCTTCSSGQEIGCASDFPGEHAHLGIDDL